MFAAEKILLTMAWEENLIIPLAVSALVLKYPGNFSFCKICLISETSDMISWSKMKA